MSTVETLKSEAKRLRSHFSKKNIQISNSQALEAIAAIHEHKDWNTAVAMHGAAYQGDSKSAAAELYTVPRATICITPEMTIDDVRKEVTWQIRNNPNLFRLRVDASVSDKQIQEAYRVADEIERKGFNVVVDTALNS